jgi:UDP-N-acetylglucosamine 4,6-dehydratase/UDP-glucose 4-epimerase
VFDGKKVLITGGTGSLGNALTRRLLETDVDTIRIYSRNEYQQIQMQSRFNDKRLRFFIGDIRDKERLYRALEDVNIVIHAAALKHVPVAEYNPFEAVKTNVNGAQNLIEGCLDQNVELALAVGTDKAVSPFNTYGATKFLMERLFISANFYKGKHNVKFLCTRYGNVLGSSGSVVPLFVEQIMTRKKITITDESMTRFTITMDQALDLILRSIKNGTGGEVFVPKLPAYRVGDLKESIMELMKSNAETQSIPVRPGEKYHESLISRDEIRNTYETKEDYVIFEPQTQNHDFTDNAHIVKTSRTDEYSSDKVPLLKKDEIKKILEKERIIPVK